MFYTESYVFIYFVSRYTTFLFNINFINESNNGFVAGN